LKKLTAQLREEARRLRDAATLFDDPSDDRSQRPADLGAKQVLEVGEPGSFGVKH
jgi:hypothetical protein